MKAKITPGPWQQDGLSICDDRGYPLARVLAQCDGREDVDNANARAIAELPAMLDLLRDIHQIYVKPESFPNHPFARTRLDDRTVALLARIDGEVSQ